MAWFPFFPVFTIAALVVIVFALWDIIVVLKEIRDKK